MRAAPACHCHSALSTARTLLRPVNLIRGARTVSEPSVLCTALLCALSARSKHTLNPSLSVSHRFYCIHDFNPDALARAC